MKLLTGKTEWFKNLRHRFFVRYFHVQQKIKCLVRRCSIQWSLAGNRVRIACGHCGRVYSQFELPVVCWVEVRNYGFTVEAFTRTFKAPQDVPRAQRIQGTACYPLIAGTQVSFEPFKGMSPADEEAVAKAKHSDRFSGAFDREVKKQLGYKENE